MKFKKLFCCLIFGMLFFQNTTNAAQLFSPKNCEFSVLFPDVYDEKELFAANGQSAVVAKNPNGQPLKLSAECWPRLAVTTQEYAKNLSPKMAERGITVHSVELSKTELGETVTLAGVAGEGTKKYYIRFISVFGKNTRLDLLLLEKTAMPSAENLAFRNSVKRK